MSKTQNVTFCVLAGVGAITFAYKIYEQSTRFMTKLKSTNTNHTASPPPGLYNLHTDNYSTAVLDTMHDYLRNCTTPNNILRQEVDDCDTAFRAAQHRPRPTLDNRAGPPETYASTLDDLSLQTDSDDGTGSQAARHIHSLALVNQLVSSEAVPRAPILSNVNLLVVSDETDFLRLNAPVIGYPHTYENYTSRGAFQLSRLPSGIPAYPSMFVGGHEDHEEGPLTLLPRMMETNQTTDNEHIVAPWFDPMDYDIYYTTVQTEDRSAQPKEASSPYNTTIPRVSELIIERPDERSSAAVVSITSSQHYPKVLEYRAQLPLDLSRLSIKVERDNWHPGDNYASIGRVLNNIQSPSRIREISLEVPKYLDYGSHKTLYHTLLDKFYGNLTKLTLKGNAISVEDCVTIISRCPRIEELEIESLQPVDSAMCHVRTYGPSKRLFLPHIRQLAISSDVDLELLFSQLSIHRLHMLSIKLGKWAACRFNPSKITLSWSNCLSLNIQGGITFDAERNLRGVCGDKTMIFIDRHSSDGQQ